MRMTKTERGSAWEWKMVIFTCLLYTSPTEEEIQIVQEYINTERPVGDNPVVSAAESIDVTIVCEIHKTAGYTEETVKSQIRCV